MSTVREVTCPRCKTLCLYAPSNPFRPFCSDRCKQMDWGAWAMESYSVAAPPPPEGEADVGLAKPEPPPRLN
ncbi:MAG: DNA gyrase inhibitor YacG [Pseudomonadota bacterium]